MGIVDTHCHIDVPAFDADREDVIVRALNAGVEAMILIGMHPESWRSTSALSSSSPCLVRTAGVHPGYVGDFWNEHIPSQLIDELNAPDIVAVGEAGLDFYRSKDNRDQQFEAFECQLNIATKRELPIIIHQRSAEDDLLAVLKRFAPVSGVLHCFGGNWRFARQLLDIGLHLGIGGIATFPKAGEVRDAVARAPSDRLVLETDAPYLAPQPWRGKRNEPSYLPAVIETLADARNENYDQVVEATTGNAVALFGSGLASRLTREAGVG